MNIQIKILDKRLYQYQKATPDYATLGAAGLDLRAMLESDTVISPNETLLVPSGIAIYIKNMHTCSVILPRSGLGHKSGIVLGNLVGIIDSDYQGQIFISVWNRSVNNFTIQVGERIAQMVFLPIIKADFQVVVEFEESERNSAGFGSTGKQ